MSGCRLCESGFSKTWTVKDAKSKETLQMGLCSNCGLVQQTLLPTDDELKVYYSHNYREDYKSVHQPKLKYVRRAGQAALDRLDFMRRAGLTFDGRSLIDIGAGGGEFCYMAGRAGFKASGVEPHCGYSQFAREQYGISVNTQGIADLQYQQADVITLFHVFEHLAHPKAVIEKVWSSLKPGGTLIIEVPNILQADASPHNIYFKAHLFYYSRYSLTAAASPYFELIYSEDAGNLMMAFRRRETPLAQPCYPSKDQLTILNQRLAQKGWSEYLLKGRGWTKPFKRIQRMINEARQTGSTPKQVLDTVKPEGPRTWAWVGVSSAMGVYLLVEC